MSAAVVVMPSPESRVGGGGGPAEDPTWNIVPRWQLRNVSDCYSEWDLPFCEMNKQIKHSIFC